MNDVEELTVRTTLASDDLCDEHAQPLTDCLREATEPKAETWRDRPPLL